MIKHKDLIRLPLDGQFDLTYRCNNNCIHCWLWLPPDAKEELQELSIEEIFRIVGEARNYGTQAWQISGGEPMLRPDFFEILNFITQKSIYYSLNTNGTLITPKIAKLLKRKGRKMVALYGATSNIHDKITRTPGSFEATMRGFSYLKEAGANFTVQIIPMRDNFHQYHDMLTLAQDLSHDYRIGSSWLFLSANHSISRNQAIIDQRLRPSEVVALDLPNPSIAIMRDFINNSSLQISKKNNSELMEENLLRNCISRRQSFHLDPYGGMSFCVFIKDPAMRFNLRQYSFKKVWDELIPSIKYKIRGEQEYLENCGSCDLRHDCHWCPVYSYLEHGRYSAKIDYLCKIAEETQKNKIRIEMTHKRIYQIAGITILVCADFPITEDTFSPAINKFEVNQLGEDRISIRLVPSVPLLSDLKLGREIYRTPPWAIFRQKNSWIYIDINNDNVIENPKLVSIFNDDHSQATVYNNLLATDVEKFHSLTTFTTDQILLSRILADRQAFFIHSAGMIIDGQGFLFVGHSDTGKSTIMKLLRGQGEMLGDDRIIVRQWPEGFRIHGTWSHGELHDVSTTDAPLKGIFFLEQAKSNNLIPILDTQELLGLTLSHVIKALVTEDWWDKILDVINQMIKIIPAFRLEFDQSGKVIDVLKEFTE